MTLPACTTVPPSPALSITSNTCPALSPCTMPAMAPQTNAELSDALDTARAAWAACAAQVDAIVQCQARDAESGLIL
ncbi:Rz1-like lysis system protein LysC [Robbsia andropogonis]|uniref:Rz1-like lysis system protein LysC n=1 Tax=Robbsia andropogonis TaxID=28092 RepID=UPI003D259A85